MQGRQGASLHTVKGEPAGRGQQRTLRVPVHPGGGGEEEEMSWKCKIQETNSEERNGVHGEGEQE